MPALFSPGISYVFSTFAPKLVATPVLILLLEQLQKTQTLFSLSLPPSIVIPPVPRWLLTPSALVISSLLGTLANLCGRALWQTLIQQYEMYKSGAVPVRVVKGKWPGNLDVLQKLLEGYDDDYAYQFLDDVTEEYGYLYCLRLLGEDIIVTMNPNHIKRVLATDFPIFEKGQPFQSPTKSVLGSGIFNSDGELWKFHRNMTRPFFSRERTTDFEIFRRHSDHAVELIKQRCLTGEVIDLQDIAGRLTMDSATEFLFGRSVNSMASPLPLPGGASGDLTDGENAFVRAFNAALDVCAFRINAGEHWALWEFKEDRTRSHMKVIYDYLDPIVDEAIREKKQADGGDSETDHTTLLGHLASEIDDRTFIRDELVNILLAGRDTTAHAITAILYFLTTEDKSIFNRLRQEVLDVVGSSDPRPTFEQIKEMRYLRAVINESLRLMPSVPANVRQAAASSIWTGEDGIRYYIPKGATIAWSTIGLHRRKELWGPDALQFDPDRWLDERNKKYYLSNPFIFLPFHGGPRTCLGQQFALNQASFVVTRLLQAFDDIQFSPESYPDGTLPPPEWKESGKLRKPMEKLQPKTHLTMFFKGGLWVRMHRDESQVVTAT